MAEWIENDEAGRAYIMAERHRTAILNDSGWKPGAQDCRQHSIAVLDWDGSTASRLD